LADDAPVWKEAIAHPTETWFLSDAGGVILCRSYGEPAYSNIGSWWRFELSNDEPRIQSSDGWIVLSHERK
jgi:D-serine deaminase-like pyridoxal phosphate-dependent protein